ncbi:MAG: Rubredoxin [candidate division TM6 bacterium GW2011_GWF2_37_49]|nr:MAG: Rubredoxin [candidate division TM6 bacterium GW2011_GWF2_37_49]
MKVYICSVCGYLYDDESAEKTVGNLPLNFEELPNDWTCPECGVPPDLFNETQSDRVPDTSASQK